jgi:hypothetical protein
VGRFYFQELVAFRLLLSVSHPGGSKGTGRSYLYELRGEPEAVLCVPTPVALRGRGGTTCTSCVGSLRLFSVFPPRWL